VMAFEALSSLGVTGSANPELGTIVASDHPGNGNGMLEAGEGGIVSIELKNTSGIVDATAISAILTTTTPGVSITLPGVSAYANLPKLTGAGNNLSPFTFTLASEYPCGQAIDFVLTVAYAGEPNPRALRFTIPSGPLVNINTALDLTAPLSPMTGVATASGTQIGRVSRNGVATTCATTPKVWPGIIGAASHQYDSYTFTATQSACTTFTLASTNGINLFLDGYSPSFNSGDILTGYVADAGSSGSLQSFGMAITAGQEYTLTVHDVPSGAASGSNYNLQFSGCALSSMSPNQIPVARAQDVNAVANSSHTASASVDNGSYDPDASDTITVTQMPAGPYPVAVTPVVLTVVDNRGATAQANATVTVVDSNFDFGGQALPAMSANAGQSAIQTITIRPNPGPWNSLVTFACSGLPALATCAFNPISVTPGNSDARITLTVATTGWSSAITGLRKSWLATWLGFSSLGLLILAGSGRRHRRGMRMLLSILALGFLSLTLLDCGGKKTDAAPGGTPAGTYTITVTATSGGMSRRASFPLAVN